MPKQPSRRNHRAAADDAGSHKHGKKSGAWFLMLFALPFAAVGIGMLVLGVLPALYDWARMQSWHAVPAQVVSAQLHTHRGSKSGRLSPTPAPAAMRRSGAAQPNPGSI